MYPLFCPPPAILLELFIVMVIVETTNTIELITIRLAC